MPTPFEQLIEFLSQTPAGPNLPATAGQPPIQGPRRPVISTGGGGGAPLLEALGIGLPQQQTTLQGGISVSRPKPKSQQDKTEPEPQPIPSSIDVGSLRQQFVQGQGQQQAEQDKKRAAFIGTLLRIGVPLGAAVAGSVNPNILPQASGLATGFADEISKQDVARSKQSKEEELVDVKIVEGGELKTIGKARKKDIVKTTQQGFQFPQIDLPGGQTGDAVKQAQKDVQKIKEADVVFTMKQNGLSREEVLNRLGVNEEQVEK